MTTPADLFPEIFADKVDADPDHPHGCWIWTGTINPDGVGMWKRLGRNARAHRWAWEFVHGPVADPKMSVFRTCATSTCVCPGHLFLTNHFAEMDRRRAKAEYPRGESHGSSVLTDADVRKIRDDYAAGDSVRQIALRTGMARTSIDCILTGKTWRHVTGGTNIMRGLSAAFETAPVPPHVLRSRELYAQGLSVRVIAERLNIGKDTVLKIVTGRSWRHVTGGTNISRGSQRVR